jgi:predicted Fe-S protein YdhL (DUF1289 family)
LRSSEESNTTARAIRKRAASHAAGVPHRVSSARMNAPPADPLASPCVRNCCLDDDNVCMGCGRSLDEIVAWGTASGADKAAILARSRERSRRRAERCSGR